MTTTKATTNQYEIGGVCVEMTDAQAERWNSASTTLADLRTVLVHIAGGPHGRYVTLRRATSTRLEPEIAAMMSGAAANRIS